MSRAGFWSIVTVDAALWAVLYFFWSINALPLLVAVSALGVLFGSLMRLQTVMDAPRYDRPAAHQYSGMAVWAASIAALAVWFL